MNDWLISIVIATRNRSEQLRACLESLRASPAPPGWTAEIIVVDNGSTDDTMAVAGSFRLPCATETLHYIIEPCMGKALAVNRGTATARGAIVAFLDDDVIVSRDWLTEIIDHFERDPSLAVLAGRVLPAEAEGPRVAITRSLDEVPLSAARSLEGLVLGCNLAVRRDVLHATKGRDTRLGPGRGLAYEDIDFVYRALKAGYRGVFSPRPTVFHRPGSRNRSVEYARGRGAYYAKHVARGDVRVMRQASLHLFSICRQLSHPFDARARLAVLHLCRLAIGAVVMLARMATAKVPLGLLATGRRRSAPC